MPSRGNWARGQRSSKSRSHSRNWADARAKSWRKNGRLQINRKIFGHVSTLELEHGYFTSIRQGLPKRHVMTKHRGFLFLTAIGLCLQPTGLLPAQAASAMKTLVTAPGAGKETTAGQDTQGFSAAFLTTSIRQLEDAMLWKEGITRVIRYNAPPGPWLDNYGARAAES